MYIARFSYDVLPVDRGQAMEFIRRELDEAREAGLSARLLVPFTRGPDCPALQFEIELRSLDQLDRFRHQGAGERADETGDWMHAFSRILRSPPVVEVLRVHN
ncbi:hypothetical protein [Propylenella binzhouense]|uniref:Uncharacterized protein n=1 Tax=Propylenella binzhouense TaxID=2555902 RepID=A0A964WTR1_9HYPH|nr:hypothetical protein [Propylenella binzhouense]MYZ48259.1 hypothetical protein [Propylenella binzhouense]